MKDVYSFVDAVKKFPNQIAILEDTIIKILTQTVECVFFIREYCGQGFGGMHNILYFLLYVLISTRATNPAELLEQH